MSGFSIVVTVSALIAITFAVGYAIGATETMDAVAHAYDCVKIVKPSKEI